MESQWQKKGIRNRWYNLRCGAPKIKLTDTDLRRIATFIDLEGITGSTPINDILTALSIFLGLDSEHDKRMYWQGQADDDGCEFLKDPFDGVRLQRP